jgi:Concanavalin A-like lectin/glucanases superfamily
MPILSAFGAARTIPGSSGVGKYSYDFNGSSYFAYPSSSSFSIGTQQFSIECFVYLDSYPSSTAVILDFGYSVASVDAPQRVQFFINSSGQPAFVRNNWPTSPTSTTVTSSEALSLSTWTYIAVSRISTGEVRIFVNANQRAAATISGTISSGTGITPSVGNGTNSAQTTRFLDGKISNLRFNLGSSISTATVPTSPLTAQATTKMLTCQSSTIKDNSVANSGGPWTLTNSGVTVSTSSPF